MTRPSEERTQGARAFQDTVASGSAATLDPGPPGEIGQALSRGLQVDRYVVLDELGRGAMGVVYAAYDPELDRKVALKVLVPRRQDAEQSERGRIRLLREAQALARLSHPNIVGIHDVGTLDGQVWIAMEFVEGVTLGAWLRARDRDWREVLEVLTPAGRGLEAAHAAGLLHRDFKPENVMVGDDGRVRVMDLGLARAVGSDTGSDASGEESANETPEMRDRALSHELTRAGAILGTPAYMSPEQFLGQPTEPTTDQFSFCATLWEGVYGQRPFSGSTLAALAMNVSRGKIVPPPARSRVPGWLRQICLRGLSAAPDRRFPSMGALLEEVELAQARRRRRQVVAGALVLVGSLAGVAGWQQVEMESQRADCRAQGDAILELWSAERQEDLVAALAGVGPAYGKDSAARIVEAIDGHVGAWRETRSEVCVATRVDGSSSEESLARSTWCLEERRADLEALIEHLSKPDRTILASALPAALALGSPGACGDPVALARLPAPPADREAALQTRRRLAAANAELSSGSPAQAQTLSSQALSQAGETGWGPLVASALLARGRSERLAGEMKTAAKTLEAAYFRAVEAGAHDVASDAAIVLVRLVGDRLYDPEMGLHWANLARASLRALGEADVGRTREARLAANEVPLRASTGRGDGALEELDSVLVGLERELGGSHPAVADVLVARSRTAIELEMLDEARQSGARALEIHREALGSGHPELAVALLQLATVEHQAGKLEEGLALEEEALKLQEGAYGPEHPVVAGTLGNITGSHWRLGHLDEAEEAGRRAVAIIESTLGPDDPRLSLHLEDLGLIYSARGEHERERDMMERCLALREKSLGLSHPKVGVALMNLGVAEAALGNFEAARSAWERALSIRRANKGPDAVGTAEVVLNLATLDQDTGRLDEAHRRYEEVISVFEAKLGSEHFNVGLVLNNLAAIDLERGNLELANERYGRSLTILQSGLGEDHPVTAHPTMGLARVALVAGERGALALAQRASALLGTNADPQDRAEVDFLLARALWSAPVDEGRDRKLASSLARGAERAYATIDPDHRELVSIRRWLGGDRD